MGAIDRLRQQARRVASHEAGEEVPSPCVSICRMDDNVEFCVGCLRTLDEIAAWGRMADEEKRATWALIEQRIAERQA